MDSYVISPQPNIRRPRVWFGRIAVAVRPSILFNMFESFGSNCEFGTVQGSYKARNLGLLRYALTSIDGLVTLLDERFRSLRMPERLDLDIEVRRPLPHLPHEYVVKLEKFGIQYHAGLVERAPDPQAFRTNQLRRLALLSRKMIEQLEENEKIFVFKSNKPVSRTEVDRLADAMRAYGPTTLLWVTLEDAGHPAGHVERLGDGLLRGYIDWFAPPDDVSRSSPRWRGICMNAYRLWQRREG